MENIILRTLFVLDTVRCDCHQDSVRRLIIGLKLIVCVDGVCFVHQLMRYHDSNELSRTTVTTNMMGR